MLSDSISILKLLEEIKTSHYNCMDQYNSIVFNANKVLMSKNKKVSLYGMFYPYDKIGKYFKYDGRLIINSLKCDFIYYFNNDKLQLTVRKIDENDVYYIYYYYRNDRIDIIWYSSKRQVICVVGFIEKIDSIRFRFIESDDSKEFKAYKEFLFDDERQEIKQTIFAYRFISDSEDYVKINYFKSINY